MYREAVYGIRNIKVMIDAAIFRALLPYLASKNCGMVAEFRCCVMILVRLPRTTQARRDPSSAFPIPTQVEAIPYFQPNCPA